MQACSTAHSVSVPTLDPKETVMNLSALMDALETALLKCVEGLGTSTSSTLMHTSQLLMTLDVEALHKTPTTKGGLMTWAIVTYQHRPRVHLLPARPNSVSKAVSTTIRASFKYFQPNIANFNQIFKYLTTVQ